MFLLFLERIMVYHTWFCSFLPYKRRANRSLRSLQGDGFLPGLQFFSGFFCRCYMHWLLPVSQCANKCTHSIHRIWSWTRTAQIPYPEGQLLPWTNCMRQQWLCLGTVMWNHFSLPSGSMPTKVGSQLCYLFHTILQWWCFPGLLWNPDTPYSLPSTLSHQSCCSL